MLALKMLVHNVHIRPAAYIDNGCQGQMVRISAQTLQDQNIQQKTMQAFTVIKLHINHNHELRRKMQTSHVTFVTLL